MLTITWRSFIFLSMALLGAFAAQNLRAAKPIGGTPSAAKTNPAIAFVATQRSGRMDVIVASANLASEIVLTANLQPGARGTSRLFGSPAWSADGSTVAFWAQDVVNGVYGKMKLYVAKADGSQTTLVRDFNTQPGPGGPAYASDGLNWTPSGKELIYTPASSDRVLWSIDVASGATRVLLDGFFTGDPVGQPSLSPDLNLNSSGYQGMLAVTGDDGTGYSDIFLVPIADDASGYLTPIDENQIVNLSQAPGTSQFHPSWSPDGSEIACFDNEALGIANLVTGDVRHVPGDFFTHVKGHDRPAWSSDANWLVYRSQLEGITDLTIASANGLVNPTNYTNSTRWEEAPAWNPRWNPVGAGGF